MRLVTRRQANKPLCDFAPAIYLVMPYRPEGSLTDWLRHRENKDVLSPQDIAQLVSGYAPAGNIKTTLTNATLTDAKSGTITLMVNAEGVWAYQFTDAQKQALARLVTGKTKSEAQTLLASQTGVGQVMITHVGRQW